MKPIQWFPGHMHKAQKEIKQVLPKIDLIIELLDARIPYSSENPFIAKLRGSTPSVKLLNKADLADADNLQQWLTHLNSLENTLSIATSLKPYDAAKSKDAKSTVRNDDLRVLSLRSLSQENILRWCSELVANASDRKKKWRVMVLGVPNVGKSTFINIIADRNIAKTGNEAAVTKAQQSVHVSDALVLVDTPGILWAKQQNPSGSYRLAVLGSMKDTVVDYIDAAVFVVDFLLQTQAEVLLRHYSLANKPTDAIQFLEQVGAARGCIARGGRVDLNKISERVIGDIRSARVGAFWLETPDSIARELAQLDDA